MQRPSPERWIPAILRRMFTEERRHLILSELKAQGRVTVSDLATRLTVSEDTVRRDLRALASEGYLQKAHGGAVLLDIPHLPWQTRTQILSDSKTRIGQRAAQLVEAGQVVLLDAGSTQLALAQHLKVRPLTVLTNSLDIAQLFADDEQVTLILAAGTWQPSHRVFLGETALQTLAGIRADWAFVGVCAIHPQAGVTAANPLDAQWKRALSQHAVRTALLADHSKFHQLAPYFVSELSQIDVLVTDQPDDTLQACGVQLLCAPPNETPR